MSSKQAISFLSISVVLLFIITSCSTIGVYQMPGIRIGNGPPAHAQAHGYHRKQVAGVELIFDSGLGLYMVDGYPDHYYHNGYFYRLNDAVWEMSLQPNTGWSCVSISSLPPGLQAKNNGKDKNHPIGRSGKIKKL
jgi:hypothetical protein